MLAEINKAISGFLLIARFKVSAVVDNILSQENELLSWLTVFKLSSVVLEVHMVRLPHVRSGRKIR